MKIASVNFLLLLQNTWNRQFKRREVSFWSMVSEASVHRHLSPLFLRLWRGSTLLYGRHCITAYPLHRGNTEREVGPVFQCICTRSCLVTHFLQLGPQPKISFHHSPWQHKLDSCHQHKKLEIFQSQTVTETLSTLDQIAHVQREKDLTCPWSITFCYKFYKYECVIPTFIL